METQHAGGNHHMGLWATTPLPHNKVRHCAEHALDMRPKSRRAKVWIRYLLPPSKNCVVLSSTSEQTSLTMPRVREVVAISGPTNQQISVGLNTIMNVYLPR